MKLDLKKKWIAALRSGKYKQGKKRLRIGGKGGPRFCCLGVLEDLMGERSSDRTTFDNLLEMESGLTRDNCLTLTGMNDGDCMIGQKTHSFEEIADYIKKNL